MIYAKFDCNWHSCSGEEDFLKIANVFSLFRHYLPLEKEGVLHLKDLNSLHSRMICAKFGLNWPVGSGEEDF